MVVDLNENQELLTIGLPRKLYSLLKTHGKPRDIITNVLMNQKPPKRHLRTLSLDSDGCVNVNLIVDEALAESVKYNGSDSYVISLLLEHLKTLEKLEPPEPNYLGIDI